MKQTNIKKIHSSMRGIKVDMEELRRANEDAVAVTGKDSGVKMNARGDVLRHGEIYKRREKIDQEYNTMLHGPAKTIGFNNIEADSFVDPADVYKKTTETIVTPAPVPSSKPVENVKPEVKEEAPTRVRKIIEKED